VEPIGTAAHRFPAVARGITHRFKLTDSGEKEYPTVTVNLLEQV